MKKLCLFLTVIGTILPNIFVIKESLASGNIMLYAHPIDTFKGLFANNMSSAFVIDLLLVVLLFLFLSWKIAKKNRIKGIVWVWVYTFAFGHAGGAPLFLYLYEQKKADNH